MNFERALRRAIGGAGDALRYGDPAGDPPLREALAQRLAGALGIAATPGQIVTTVGATQALDIVARTLLRPGDAVLVDDPGWAVEFARFTQLGMRLLPVPRGPQGPDLAVLEQLLQAHRPRLYATVSVLHNPTGQSLSLAAAHQVLKLADAHDLTIVEDDTYAWLAPPHALAHQVCQVLIWPIWLMKQRCSQHAATSVWWTWMILNVQKTKFSWVQSDAQW